MAIGMGAGGLTMIAIGLASGESLAIPMTVPFVASLLYLCLFGSVIAFAAYLGLIQRIGAAQASYANVLIPMVALALSSLSRVIGGSSSRWRACRSRWRAICWSCVER